MKDSFGKEYSIDENDLDKFCKIHRLTHVVEYLPNTLEGNTLMAPHLDPGEVFCYNYVLLEGDGVRNYIFESKTQYPISDDFVLQNIKQWFRNDKLNKLL